MKKKVILVYSESHSSVLSSLIASTEKAFSREECEIKRIEVNNQKAGYLFYEEIKKYNPDYLVSFALAGFEWSTLAEQVSYNLLYAKQIHIILGDYNSYEMYLKKEYAINLFFYTDSSKWMDNWENRFKGMPYLKKVPALYLGKSLTSFEKEQNDINMENIVNDFWGEIS